ncbi:MAG: glycosyltransferase N-terminal domain-containing protein [Candidatus Binatia bacterium]
MTNARTAPGWWRARLGLFNAAVVSTGVLLSPAALIALALKRDWRVGLAERFGTVTATPPGRPAIWIHGASVGELTALAPVVRALRRELPDHRLVLSSMTIGGRHAAVTRIPEADTHMLFPLDLPAAVTRALDRVRPSLVLFSETELWPNFLTALAARRIPAIMVSGRISPNAFARYHRWRWLFAPALESVRWFCVQTLESARRLVALGAPATRVIVTGSLKTVGPAAPSPDGMTLATLGVDTMPVLVAASTRADTHDALIEDEAILAAFARIRSAVPNARLLLAPRKPDRFADVAALARARGFSVVRRSTLAPGPAARWPADATVLVLDTLGELAGLYRGARVAFVGGTLAPIGGHNVLEPAAVGTPVVVGPHVENVERDVARLVGAGGAIVARDADDLVVRLAALFVNGAAAAAAGNEARLAVGAADGPLTVTLAIIRGTLAADAGATGAAEGYP